MFDKQTLKPFVMDCGRSDIKTAGGTAQAEDSFMHAFAFLSPSQYERETKRTGAPVEDYFIVNDVHYILGPRAVREGFKLQYDARRYSSDYYGVLAAIAMARAFRKSQDVFWVGTHAPEDTDYIDDLLAAVSQTTWTVEWCDHRYIFRIVDGVTIDEPLAGYYNAVLRRDGRGYADKMIIDGETLVLDTGGYTTDGAVIDAGGQIDYSTFGSTHVGVLEAVERFGADFRTKHKQLLKGSMMDRRVLHTALRTGQLNLRGLGVHNVKKEAALIRRQLAAEVSNFYDTYGGAANYDTLLLTGGGSALLQVDLRSLIRHNRIRLADSDAARLERANARGALKWYRMQESAGTFL